MKRIILSRKGFDAKAGGNASPIFHDGRIFSIPIPQKNPSPKKYRDLNFDGVTGSQLLFESSSKTSLSDYCHTDPMLDEKIGIFGQANSSQTELRNNQVGKGDLFMFFGWFKNFSLRGADCHHLFGWLQIEKIIEGHQQIKKFLKSNNILHPHGYRNVDRYKNNTIYVGKKNLELNKKAISKKGYGLFKKTHKDLILTEVNRSRSKWKLPSKYFKNSSDLFLNRMKWRNKKKCTIFYRGFGQEFILDVEKNPEVIKWAVKLIKRHG